MATTPEPAGDGAARDRRDLRRGVLVNLAGYVFKLALPILLAIVTRLYGAERFGAYVLAQATIMILARLSLFGLDAAVLWWVARQDPANERSGVRGALLVSGTTAVLVAAGFAALPAGLFGLVPEGGRVARAVMAMALPPFVLAEVLFAASMGKRRMEATIFLKELLVPLTFLGAGSLLYTAGLEEHGLAIAFLASNLAGLAAAALSFAHLFRSSRWPAEPLLPPELARYAKPLWLNHVANTTLQRIDLWIVEAVLGPTSLGVYAVVMQIVNAGRSIRRSFDPIVTAIASQLAARADLPRLRDGYTYAASLVAVTQLPVLWALATLGHWILPFYGATFATGSDALLVYCVFLVALGPLGLAGIVVAGFGRSDLSLVNTLAHIVMTAAFVSLLTPRYGLVGAAVGVSLAQAGQHALQLAQLRMLAGGFLYTRDALAPLALVIGGSAVLVASWIALASAGVREARVFALLVFTVAYVPAALALRRRRATGAALAR